jgi:hypothetical protein
MAGDKDRSGTVYFYQERYEEEKRGTKQDQYTGYRHISGTFKRRYSQGHAARGLNKPQRSDYFSCLLLDNVAVSPAARA